ncbi:ABC transporter substrate-binding protein [Sulfitobacter mediterraneus]|jgi:branched-chain amino acid transport system substrate-binding protein|uniref:ABC transporter substrate-binding protein n=1 Tax=Sulfitobacter mediterraneus TaxID=83219 RepID=UPI001932C970|nr:ABC transporter substrate-binding protein [Sulfitobacter mediterraneus]MBM1632607.1 ABC transporter substrate-binding protein [Sulfitobacter mediterraneus]MBM1641259.1 ABC transporter substrate-binding protein [Sulfitobacter mediterraneus]MBM1644472.1 ABC transporter substrate-binding protein [Sulfitobacter mediterraneus]MBM1649379.1 ABC transporter substrate-binding protein [Sulfitobacter mediterraneus]MBM1653400.1 ABC transporter substrate-binding protein [Sulfitobacter mediterraneus]
MKYKLGTLAVAGLMAASPVMADLVFPSLSYRTGPYAAGGIPFADGYADYFTMLNARDGGIGGVMAKVIECETGYNTEKGVECYESTKGEGALVYQPLSTGITYQLIPKTTADNIPMHTMGYGRTSAANGKVFSHTFNYPANYWNGASGAINYLLSENGGDLNGKKIALVYHNSAYGKEPIRTLQELSAKHGFEFKEVPVDHPGQEQKSQWLQIRRDKPDYVIMYGWGVMNQVAVQEAANIRFPMENFIGIWWSGSENDVLAAGDKADGYKALTFHGVGDDFPVFDDIKKHVVDAGKAAGAGDQIGTVLYNRGLYAAMLAAEAAKTAQEIHGTADITPAMMRDGMENLEITEAKMADLGMPNFGPSFSVSCENHGGPGLIGMTQWDATAKEWKLISEFSETDMSVIQPLIDEDSGAYASENNIEAGCK